MGFDFGNVPEWMAVLAAAAACGWAAWSRKEAGRSATAAEKALHQQQTPQFTAEVENPNGNDEGATGWHRLAIRVTAAYDGPLDRLQVDLLTDGVHFTSGQNGVEEAIQHVSVPGAVLQPRTAVNTDKLGTPAGLDVGDRARWRVGFDNSHDGVPDIGEVEIRVTAVQGKKRWVTLAHAPVVAFAVHQRWADNVRTQTHGRQPPLRP